MLPLVTDVQPMHFENYAQQSFVKVLSQNIPSLENSIHLVKMQMSPSAEIVQGVCETHVGFTLHLDRATNLEVSYDGDFHKIYSTPGRVNLVPYKMPMGFRWHESVVCFSCLVSNEFCEQIAVDYTNQYPAQIPFLPSIDLQDALSENLLRSLLHEVETGNTGGRLYVDSLVHTLILHTLIHSSTHSSFQSVTRANRGLSPTQVRQIRDYIDANYQAEIGLVELAAAVNFSPDYFLRQFKRSMGITPHQYLTQIRVEHAKRLLTQGLTTISDVAVQVGFYDQSHLAHHFKRAYGVSPKTYSEQAIETNGKRDFLLTDGEILQALTKPSE
jgi:AraC family transcriptional regulator